MQLVEQLRLKRTEATSRLLSRKRKLSELYSVTADQYGRPHDHQYAQKLLAFHDANDLERGRLFDESTLPPRPQIILQVQQQQTSRPGENTIPNLSNLDRGKSPGKSNFLLTPEANQKGAAESRSSSRLRHRSKSPNDVQTLPKARPNGTEIDGDGLDRLRPPTPSQTVVVEKSASSTTGTRDRRPRSPASSSKNPPNTRSDHDEDRTNLTADSSPEQVSSLQDKSSFEIDRRTRSPLNVISVQIDGETQSSPASTSAAGSANTPVPTAGSPETSPGDEMPHMTSNLFENEKASNLEHEEQDESLDHNGSRRTGRNKTSSPSTRDTHMIDQDNAQSVDVTGKTDHTSNVNRDPEQRSESRQAMRIDTQSDITSYFKPRSSSDLVESPQAIPNVTTPRRNPAITPSTQESSKRATRISSGVLQKKSVSEILGEMPKSNSPTIESPLSMITRDGLQVISSQARLLDRERSEKERSKLSTVVFTKPQKQQDEENVMEMAKIHLPGSHRTKTQERDYLYTLFENKAHSMTRQGTMSYLIQNAHKTLSTADHLIDYELQAECRILKRLYQLQEKQRWALRQYKRADEAPRPTSSWDFLLDHVKWMRTDFREERKWKLAAARGLAESCAEWIISTPEERKRLQVRIKAPKAHHKEHQDDDVIMEDGPGPALSSQTTPDLMPSNEEDSLSEGLAEPSDLPLTCAPAAIFSLGASDFKFTVDKTPAFEKLLNELPLYEPAGVVVDSTLPKLAQKLDARWKTDIVPISKYAVEKIHVKEYKPPVKQSRYEYDIDSPIKKMVPLSPQETNVALFMPENKHIRDRIHPGHSFRPPSEHPMPTQAFFETRSSSQWTQGEDDELRKLVKDYSYNWSLISSCLSPRTLYSSGADRRTPWECFERWIGLEGLPADMSKTPYFKTYSGRIEAAGRHVAAQIEEVRNRAGVNIPMTVRKRPTQPIRVERKRAQRHLAMLDAMRKLAKKRESALQKQQHQADLAAMRKVNEVNHPKVQYSTPAEFARLKQDREQKVAERHELIRQNMLAQQRALAQQRGHNAQLNGFTNGIPSTGATVRGPQSLSATAAMPNGNLQVPNGHPRQHPAMMGPGGMPISASMASQKALAQAQAQIQANIARGVPASPQQMRLLHDANKIQQEQLMRQAQLQNGMHSSPNGPHASLANSKAANSQAFMAAMAGAAGLQPSSASLGGNAGSPRTQNTKPGQALSSGHVPVLTQLANQIRELHPNLPEEEIQRQASYQITQWQRDTLAAAAGHANKRPQPHNQAAVNAAMGAVNAAAAAAAQYGQTAMMTNEQVLQYNQRMRQQQAAQHAARGLPGQIPQGMMGGMNNSPVMTMARPVSQHTNQSQMSRSVTPRDQRSGSQGTITGSGGAPQGSPRSGSQVVPT